MQLLIDRIRAEGKALPGDIVKVDGFLNHRVDTALLGALADEFAKHFPIDRITMVLTAEASGIALATICAQRYGVPLLFAKRRRAITSRADCTRAMSFLIPTRKSSPTSSRRSGCTRTTMCSSSTISWPRATPCRG